MIHAEELLSWGSRDVKDLQSYLEIAGRLNITFVNMDSYIREIDGDIANINNWFYACICLTFDEIMDSLPDYWNGDKNAIESFIESQRDKFAPYINYMDSWYRNFLDEALNEIEGYNHDEIMEGIVKYIKSNNLLEDLK